MKLSQQHCSGCPHGRSGRRDRPPGTTRENLDGSANGENDEIEGMYPRFIREAEVHGRADAVASFQLAVEREKHHRAMFQEAFAGLDG